MTQQSQTEPLSAALLRRMDDVCLRFEEQWQSGRRPDARPFVASFPEDGRGELLAELLLLEWDYRRRQGESFNVDEYVRQLTPWQAAVEQAWQRWKERCQSRSTALPPTDTPTPGGMTATPLAPLPEGYEKSEPIGKGGMGEVFKAFDPRLKRWVALKQVRLDKARPDQLARFRIEAEALAKLAHPHIVKVHGFTDRGGQPVLEMEYVEGATLEERLKKAPLSPSDAARLVAILAWAVHAAHEKGIVHRDLKPANVLMDSPVAGSPDNVLGGFAKISDFGLAALADSDTGQTLSGAVLGTPAYMSPEQAAGKKHEIGPPADVWALGVILYRCLTGALPFQGDSVLETLERVKTMQMRPLRDVCPDVPAELEEVCLACLSKAPADRPAAAVLAERLDALASNPMQASTVEWRPRRQKVRRLAVAAGLIAASVLAVAAGLAIVNQRRDVAEKPSAVGEQPDAVGRAGAEAELPTVTLRVEHYVRDADEDVLAGVIGEQSFETRYDDQVVIHVKLSRRAHCFLIGCNFDGKEQLLWPCDEQHFPHAGDPARPPDSVERFSYPPPARVGPDAKPGKVKRLALNDDKAGGMQAYLVVASRQTLPSYAEWSKQRGAIPWRKLSPARGVWASSGETLDRLTPVVGRRRGQVVELEGEPPLLQLCGWARGKDVDVVEALTFPVYRREGK